MSLSQVIASKRQRAVEIAQDKADIAEGKEEEGKDVGNLGRQLTEGALGSLGVGEGMRRFGETTAKIGKGLKKTASTLRSASRALGEGRKIARSGRSALRDLARPARSHLSEASRTEIDNFQNEGGDAESVLRNMGIEVNEGGGGITDALNPLTNIARGIGNQVVDRGAQAIQGVGNQVIEGVGNQVAERGAQVAERGAQVIARGTGAMSRVARLGAGIGRNIQGADALVPNLAEAPQDADVGALFNEIQAGADPNDTVNVGKVLGKLGMGDSQVADDTEWLAELARGGITGAKGFIPPPLMTQERAEGALRGAVRGAFKESALKESSIVGRLNAITTEAEDALRTQAVKAGETTARIAGQGARADAIAGGRLGELPNILRKSTASVDDILSGGAELEGETGISAGLDTVGGALETVGTLEDATGILAPLGVLTNIAGAVGLVGGLITGGTGFYKELTSGFNHAQDEVKNAQTKPVNIAGGYIVQSSNHSNLQNLR
tara:strand:- start:626 stop:2113 length:1488 start_codon:yes stop_codon:yes gene_type:complete